MFLPQVDYLCCTGCLEETDGVPYLDYEIMPYGDRSSMVPSTFRVSECCGANLAWVRHAKCPQCDTVWEPPSLDAESGLCEKCFDADPELGAKLPDPEVFEPRSLFLDSDIL